MLEASIWEKIKQGASNRLWRKVAEDFVKSAQTDWPSRLCSFEEAQQIGVEIEIEALTKRFQRLAKRGVRPKDARARALKVIMQSGQLVTPTEGMTLWQYFKPEHNTVVNKGALAAKEASLERNRKASRKRAAPQQLPP